jgi:alkanesulfonate monooxygenase
MNTTLAGRSTAEASIPARQDKSSVQVFSTCPSGWEQDGSSYLQHVADVAQWSEENGCEGILVYTDNGLLDPWLVAQQILQHTSRLCPLVAIQPVYMHPYTVAKMVSTLGTLYGRRVYLNMVAGGFKNDLLALNDDTPHDRRYDRLVEYTKIIKLLLGTNGPVTFVGEFYQVHQLKLTPSLPPDLFPGVLMSGSSDAGLAAARSTGATPVKYPKPASAYQDDAFVPELNCGVRVGVIAREQADEAWAVAHERFPTDRRGQITRMLASKVSDSTWHQQLADLSQIAGQDNPYWLVPFENYKTNCPYLVGSYDVVAREIGRYLTSGHTTFILDIPQTRDELQHVGRVFKQAQESGADSPA